MSKVRVMENGIPGTISIWIRLILDQNRPIRARTGRSIPYGSERIPTFYGCWVEPWRGHIRGLAGPSAGRADRQSRFFVEVVKGSAKAGSLLQGNKRGVDAGELLVESLAKREDWLHQSLYVSMVQGSVEVEELKRRVEFLSGGSWDVSKVSP
ncbi:hypothetical protein Taro_023683 [Colocasia esculenta]|uniref:Uncharacterized protein n=1 Tax=Colocasia esculenta TaxID=4460 RepID=A0A843V5B4_COLES|nr:hypothetical protein [Colocasia esculenta]